MISANVGNCFCDVHTFSHFDTVHISAEICTYGNISFIKSFKTWHHQVHLRVAVGKIRSIGQFVCVSCFSRVQLFATLWTIAHQASLSMEFSRQEYWSRLPFPSPGDLPDLGIEPRSPALKADSLLSEPQGKPKVSLGRLYCPQVFSNSEKRESFSLPTEENLLKRSF